MPTPTHMVRGSTCFDNNLLACSLLYVGNSEKLYVDFVNGSFCPVPGVQPSYQPQYCPSPAPFCPTGPPTGERICLLNYLR